MLKSDIISIANKVSNANTTDTKGINKGRNTINQLKFISVNPPNLNISNTINVIPNIPEHPKLTLLLLLIILKFCITFITNKGI